MATEFRTHVFREEREEDGGIGLGAEKGEKSGKRERRARAAAETTDGATATHCHCKMNKGQECRCTRHLQRFGRKVGSQAQMNSGYTRVA